MYAFFAILPLFVQLAVASDCTRTYTVQDGDICDDISANNNVSTYQLAASNPTIDQSCGNLVTGQQLCLGTAGEDCTNTYVVKSGDYCDLIAGAAGINSTILELNNPQIDPTCSNLYVGEVLCVAGQVQAPPAGAPVPTAIPATATPAQPSTVPTAAPAPVSSAASIPSSAPTEPSSAAPSSAVTATSAPAASASATSDDGDDDDDSLPFCDEL